jgi:hypothetical protein
LGLYIPYARHYNPLLIWNLSWILTIHKVRILQKKLLKKPFLAFKNGVKSIQTAGYNGAHTVVKLGDKERFDKEQIGIKEPFPVTNWQFTS